MQDAARRTLGSLKGRDVDDAIVALLGQPAPAALTAELLRAVADRRIFLAKPAVSAALAAASPAVRIEGLKTLRAIGTPSDASPVLDLLLKSGDDAERAEAEKTVTALLQKIGEPGEPVTSRQDAPGRREGPGCPGDAHRPAPADGGRRGAARAAHGARRTPTPGVVDAAARAIAEWPTATARDDMLKILRESKDETHRLLAFAGLVRLVSLDANRLPEAAVADLKGLSGLAWRPEEQKLVLGALAAFPCQDALNLATGFLAERRAQGRGAGGDRQDHAEAAEDGRR